MKLHLSRMHWLFFMNPIHPIIAMNLTSFPIPLDPKRDLKEWKTWISHLNCRRETKGKGAGEKGS